MVQFEANSLFIVTSQETYEQITNAFFPHRSLIFAKIKKQFSNGGTGSNEAKKNYSYSHMIRARENHEQGGGPGISLLDGLSGC